MDKSTITYRVIINWTASTVELRDGNTRDSIVSCSHQVTNHTIANAFRDLAYEALKRAYEQEHRGTPEEHAFSSQRAREEAEAAIRSNSLFEHYFTGTY